MNFYKKILNLFKKQELKNSVIVENINNAFLQRRYNSALFQLLKELNHNNLIRWACYNAEVVLPIFETAYSNDKRPREAIKAAKSYLSNKKPSNYAFYSSDVYASAARTYYDKMHPSVYSAVSSAYYAVLTSYATDFKKAAESAYHYAINALSFSPGTSSHLIANKMTNESLTYGINLLKEQLNETK